MRAVVYVEPGRLELQERPEPEPPEGDQVLLDVSHVGVCGTDLLLWEGGLERVRPPVVLGHEFSGTVRHAPAAWGLEAGSPVVAEPLLPCGACLACRAKHDHVCSRLRLVGIDVDGAAAAQVVVPAGRLHRVPEGLSLRDAALAEPTAVALHMLGRAGVTAGEEVLVVGGGPIGVLVALVARAAGARVVVSEPHTRRREVAEGLGLDTSDPASEDLTDLVDSTSGGGFDVAFEVTGLAVGLAAAVEATRPRGTVLLGGLPHGALSVVTSPAVLKELTLVGSRVYRPEDFDEALRLLADGTVPAAELVTSVVALADAVDGAFGALRDDKSEMKILIDVGGAR